MTTRSSSWGDSCWVVVSDTLLLFVLLYRAQSPVTYSALWPFVGVRPDEHHNPASLLGQ
jgi:hypothetical protein